MIAEMLKQITSLIEKDRLAEASACLQETASKHPEWMDDRFQAELGLIMKQMEYKLALKDFGFLRALALVYRYLEMNYATVLEKTVPGGASGRTTVCEEMEKESARGEVALGETALEGEEKKVDEFPDADTIWWCWLQGLENAPDIVKACYRSVQSLEKFGKRIVVLDSENLFEYVSLPSYVVEKYQQGMIGMAHFADLVRLEILTTRGGTWIDATTWISGSERLLSILDEDLFFYRAGNVSEYLIFDNWFMHARKQSRILEATKRLLYAYWQRENEAKHYFIFQLFMTLACKYNTEEYEKIPRFSNEPCHVLQYELSKPFNERRWAQLLGMSDVHKLTYWLEESTERKGTMLEKVLETDAFTKKVLA